MTATLAQIMDAMADQIRGVIDDVTDIAVQVESRWVDNPTPPTIDMYIGEPSNEPELRSFGDDLYGAEVVMVRARVSMSDSVAGQDLLLALMDDVDPLSVGQAIEEDLTLGGLASSLDVRRRSGMGQAPDSPELVGCVWEVLIVKARS